MSFETEIRDERKHALKEMLASYAWKEVALPALQSQLIRFQRKIAVGDTNDIERIRYDQGCYRAILDLVENTESVLSEDLG